VRPTQNSEGRKIRANLMMMRMVKAITISSRICKSIYGLHSVFFKIKCQLILPLFTYNLWWPLAIQVFYSGVEVGWHLPSS
jgi:hypothetical protein